MEQHGTEAALLPNIANQMRSLLSNLYLAASQVIPPEQREQDPALDAKAAILEQSFFRLLRLVNSMSAAEYLSDSQTLSLRDADLVKLVSEVCESSADLAEQVGIQLKFVCAMDRRVCAIHPAAVEQMLYHLLSNALKFTPAGGTVTVELKKSGETLRLTVSDTGCGIPPERMAHLFDGCFQPGHPTPAPYGLGLGLSLCRAIAEKHGGSITVESAPGKGSRFDVVLTFPVDHGVENSFGDRKVMLVSDDDVLCRNVGTSLGAANVPFTLAATEGEARRQLARHPADVILLNGYLHDAHLADTVKALRESARDAVLLFCCDYAQPEQVHEILTKSS